MLDIKYGLGWGDAASALSRENEQPVLRRRNQIAPPSCEIQINIVPDIFHRNGRSHDINPSHICRPRASSLGSTIAPRSRRSTLTIPHHPFSRPLIGFLTVITEVLSQACAISSASTPRTFLDGAGLIEICK